MEVVCKSTDVFTNKYDEWLYMTLVEGVAGAGLLGYPARPISSPTIVYWAGADLNCRHTDFQSEIMVRKYLWHKHI